uniref:Triosephosphate isomerase n=1 Tax=Strongyloides papillosus TaxID=174720 RepID=A0A0N5CFJ2_STREA
MPSQCECFVGGNWEMNGDKESINNISTYVKKHLKNSDEVAVEECYKLQKGAFIREISFGMLNDLEIKQLQAFIDLDVFFDNIVIAFEPVWDIKNGKTATSEQTQKTHLWIRKFLKKKVFSDAATKTRIIYDCSVTDDNCVELGKKKDIDGFLVGGAFLKPEFLKIINTRN